MIPDNTATAIAFDTEEFDTDGMFDLGQPTRLTVTTAGKYLVTVYFEFDNVPTTSFIEINVRLNGSNRIARETPVPYAASQEQNLTLSTYYSFNAGDYVELTVRQTSGGSVTFDVPDAPVLTMAKLP